MGRRKKISTGIKPAQKKKSNKKPKATVSRAFGGSAKK